ncbi:MAG: hypothetical protein OES09_12515 [Gammaproteobacteria bacterium]|nr:hypothetical protein [Gammaproteobacteria bacterium]
MLDERVGRRWSPQLITPVDFRHITFFPQSHLKLTMNPIFRDNVLFWLLEAPRD